MSLKRLSIRNFASKIIYCWFYMVQNAMRMEAVEHLCVVQEGGSMDRRSICVCCKGKGCAEESVLGWRLRGCSLMGKKNGAPPSPNLC